MTLETGLRSSASAGHFLTIDKQKMVAASLGVAIPLIYSDTNQDELVEKLSVSPVRMVLIIGDNFFLKGVISQGDYLRFVNATRLKEFSAADLIKYKPTKVVALNIPEASRIAKEKGLSIVPIVDTEFALGGVFIDDETIYRLTSDAEQNEPQMHIEALVVAGGRGERLQPLTNKIPKPLLRVAGKELVEYVFDNLSYLNVAKSYVLTRYLAEQFEEFRSRASIDFKISSEETALGTGGPVLKWLRDNESYIVPIIEKDNSFNLMVSNGDIIFNIQKKDVLDFFQSNFDVGILCTEINIKMPYGIIETSDDFVFEKMTEKPTYSYLANTGVYFFKLTIDLYSVLKSTTQEYIEMPHLINQLSERFLICSIKSAGGYYDLGTHEVFNEVDNFVKRYS